MQNKEQHKIKEKEGDILFDYFRDSLQDHSIEVDDNCWENINKRLRKRKASGALYLWPLIGVAAAAVILLFILPPKQKADLQIIKIDEPSSKTSVSNIPEVAEKSNESINPIHHKTAIKTCDTTKKLSMYLPDSLSKESSDTVKEQYNVSKKSAVVSKEPDKTVKNEFKYEDLLAEDISHKTKGKWSIAASVGSMGNLTGTAASPYSDMRLLDVMEGFMEGYQVASSSAYDEKYSAPISVGILVRKNITKTLSLESGLVYSYLSTTYNIDDNEDYQARLKLHYIGIPINLSFNIWNISNNCKLYGSTGLMAEKGVQSEYSRYQSAIGQSLSYNHNIKGLQWSANLSMGLSYKIIGNWHIYLEPRLSYYFDNNQPISIRTEKQTIIGLNSGLRFEL